MWKTSSCLNRVGQGAVECLNNMGCDAHTHVANCHAPDLDVEFNKKKSGLIWRAST